MHTAEAWFFSASMPQLVLRLSFKSTGSIAHWSLKHGDRLNIRAGSEQPNNPIKLSGALVQPGVYEYSAGLRVGDYLPSLEANYLLESDLSRGLIVRRVNAEQDIEVLTFSPVAAANGEKSDRKPSGHALR